MGAATFNKNGEGRILILNLTLHNEAPVEGALHDEAYKLTGIS